MEEDIVQNLIGNFLRQNVKVVFERLNDFLKLLLNAITIEGNNCNIEGSINNRNFCLVLGLISKQMETSGNH